MRRLFMFITLLAVTSNALSQNPELKINIDSLGFQIADTVFRTNSDYKIYINSYVDYPSNRKILVIGITDKDSNTTSKRYDIETKVHLETRTVKEINGKTYHNGPFYIYSPSERTVSLGSYKMNYLEGTAITKDSTGQIISKEICNSKKRECKGENYYSNGKIKTKYQTKGVRLFSGEYTEYYENGKIRVKGNYKVSEIKKWPPLNEKERDKYKYGEQNWLSEQEGYYSIKTGIWEYYNEDGSLKKKEEYDKDGKIIE